ncbi:AraC family transcriptional regulator [Salmonella enterica subsp. enterica serovar Enteritidis]|nr:AraC family transcriptional regulator [Salmonella enterica subsp. enterica serovar Enteritidis]
MLKKNAIKIKLYRYAILHSKNCIVTIKNKSKPEEIKITRGNIALIEKNIEAVVEIEYMDDIESFDIITLPDELLSRVLCLFEASNCSEGLSPIRYRTFSDKVFIITDNGINGILFEYLKKRKNNNNDIYEIACLFSKVNNIEQLYTSLCISVSRSFSDIVRKTIDNDISTKWRLKTLSEKLNLSEVTIRKKLENENTNFYRILLDARMQKAARLVLDSDTHINKVSYAVGMSSVSYFIKLFSDYYGLTPKQFHLKYKHRNTGEKAAFMLYN